MEIIREFNTKDNLTHPIKMKFQDYEWFDDSIPIIRKNIDIVKKIVFDVQDFLKSSDNEYIKLYDESDPFFHQNLNSLKNLSKYIENCDKAFKTIENFKNSLPGIKMFVQKNGNQYEYSLLNKLNTNYTSLAYLLTQYRLKNNLQELTIDEVFRKYFRGGHFFQVLVNYFNDNEYEVELMKEVFKTISTTTRIGRETEIIAIEMLRKKFGEDNVIDFAGDFSFVDMMGVDILVFSSNVEEWIPVQIKTSEKHLIGNPKFCKNICMTKSGENWIFKKYIGQEEVKNF